MVWARSSEESKGPFQSKLFYDSMVNKTRREEKRIITTELVSRPPEYAIAFLMGRRPV